MTPDTFIETLKHFGNLATVYLMATLVVCMIVLLMALILRPLFLPFLNEITSTEAPFKNLIEKKTKTQHDWTVIAMFTIGYSIVTGLMFSAVLTTIAHLATPYG